jgi:hypothetical protein
MNVVRIDLYIAVRNLRANWKQWDIVTRAEAVADLRRSRLSVTTLAEVVGCSATSIRRLQLIGQLPPELKSRIRAGEPAGKFLAWAKKGRAPVVTLRNRSIPSSDFFPLAFSANSAPRSQAGLQGVRTNNNSAQTTTDTIEEQ